MINTKNKVFLVLQDSTLKSTVVQDSCGHTGLASNKQARRATDRRRERVGDEKLIRNRSGRAATSLMRDAEGKHIHTLESSPLEGSCVGDLL